jgi:hypothetical protein
VVSVPTKLKVTITIKQLKILYYNEQLCSESSKVECRKLSTKICFIAHSHAQKACVTPKWLPRCTLRDESGARL